MSTVWLNGKATECYIINNKMSLIYSRFGLVYGV
jgi:hypothetical protein